MKGMNNISLNKGEAYAVLILTAEKLGRKVRYSREATRLLNIGRIAPTLVGLFQIEAAECRKYIFSNGLAQSADKVSEDFIPGPFDVLSPDGFSITQQPHFNSIPEALSFFAKWKAAFQRQGYYSSNNGRIALDNLDNECTLVRLS